MKYWTDNQLVINEVIRTLQELLKDYHYNSDTENMSKDVVITLKMLLQNLEKTKNF